MQVHQIPMYQIQRLEELYYFNQIISHRAWGEKPLISLHPALILIFCSIIVDNIIN